MKIDEIRAKFPQYADVPDGELVRGLHRKFYADMPYQQFLKGVDFAKQVDPTEGMGGLQKFNAGMGKAFMDVGAGAQQLVGMGPNAQEVQDRRALDKPLMATGAGMAGNVAGNVAALAPLAVVPGAASVAGAGAVGGAGGRIAAHGRGAGAHGKHGPWGCLGRRHASRCGACGAGLGGMGRWPGTSCCAATISERH